MRIAFKIPLYIFLAFALVFLIIISILPQIFDPNDYKLEITEAVRKLTGRHLEIEGDLKLQVLPKLAVITGKMSLNNPEGFDREVFAEFDSGFFRIRLIPLLSKQIDIKKIVLNGLKVHLIRTKDDRMNWKRFRGSSRVSGKHSIPIRYPAGESERATLVDSPLAMLFATKIDLFDAEVDYDDRVSGTKVEVRNLEFIIDRFGFNQGIYFEIQGKLSNSKPLFHTHTAIKGRIFVDEDFDHFKVEDFVWASRIDSEFLPSEFQETELNATAELNLAENTLSATNLRLSAGQTALSANLSASRIFEKPKLEGQITIEQANPLRLLKLMGIEHTGKDPSAFQSLNGDFTLALNESRLLLKDIALVLDTKPIRGVASVAGLEFPDIKFNVSAEHLDADRYLPESSAWPLPPAPESASRISGGEVEPTPPNDLGKNKNSSAITVQGILNLESLRYRGLLAEGVQMALHISNGVLRSNQRFKKFYGGQLKGSVEINQRDHEPLIALNQTLSGVNIDSVLKDLDARTPIEGKLDATIRLVGRGARMSAFKASLNGEIDAILTDGLIHGLDLEKVINDSALPTITTASIADLTRFSKLLYKATIIEGVIDNTLIEGNSAHFDFSGQGKIHLEDDTVDYHINAVIKDNPEVFAGLEIEQLKGLRIPIQIGGSLSALTFQPELKGVLKDPKVKAVAEKLKRKLDEKLDSSSRRVLDRLF